MRATRIPITIGVITLIILVYAVEWSRGGSNDTDVLISVGAIVPWTMQSGEYWRLLAAMLIHIGILHLFLNVWALYQLGGVFEMMFGSGRFLLTYFVSGLVASLASAILHPAAVSAGASGAIFGILGALIFSIRRSPVWRHQPWTKGFTQQLIGWAAINVIIGFTFPGIDNAAHIGGFIAGLLLGLIPHKVAPPPPSTMTVQVEPREPEP
ncbi:MAG: rhomboid family intramembrane serine protease [Thermoanaerobaculia bacterium]